METVRAINTKRTRKSLTSNSKDANSPEGSGFKFTYSPAVTESKASVEGAGKTQAANPVAGEYRLFQMAAEL